MQIGEQHLARLHPVVLDRNRLFDLQDQLCLFPYLLMAGSDLCPRCCELIIGDGGAGARAGLDDHLVATPSELVHPGWSDSDPILMVLDLAGHADSH
jgi:hypothetical protein